MAGSERPPIVGYVVSTWPRLSQTFVLREILAVERLGVSVRIFSTKDPDGEPIHGDVAQVRAGVTYLTLRRHCKQALRANLPLVRAAPALYARTLLAALRYRRWDVLRRLFQAGYLTDLLRREPVDHLHAHFATAPALVAMFTHQLRGVPYTFTAHARDIDSENKGLDHLIAAAQILRRRGRSLRAEIIVLTPATRPAWPMRSICSWRMQTCATAWPGPPGARSRRASRSCATRWSW
jgi:hypothetical protein